jgi:uncharacterized membrane protein
MYALLALGSAALYGAADFIGGMTARRADTTAVVVLSQAAGMLLVALILATAGTPLPAGRDLTWSAAAGLAGGIGVALLYRALAVGVMSLVAPVTAVCAVAVPVIVAVSLLGERPPLHASIGIAVAVLAIVMVSHGHESERRVEPSLAVQQGRRGLGLALASGIAIGLFFLALARTSAEAGLWPLLIARVSSVTFFGALLVGAALIRGHHSLRMPVRVVFTVIAGGIVDMLANLLYLLASREGPLTLVVTLSSLYPASTVLLARFILHERLTRRQWVGVAMALVAIVLIVRG